MVTLQGLRPLDYSVLGAAGLATLVSLAAALYTVPWRRAARGAPKATRGFNVLWRGRVALALLSAAWALSQLLRVSSLWGANSLVFGPGVTAWTGAGWMCRIYLTLGLGVLQPLCAFLTLLMLTAGLSRRHRPDSLRHPNARLLGLAALCTLPVAALQAVVAWLGLVVQYQGEPIEHSPRSVLGIFFATYWVGSAEQCGTAPPPAAGPGSGGSAAADAAVGACTLCTFPAAAVAVHALFCAALLGALWITCGRLAAAVLNNRLKRRLKLFQLAYSLLAAAGLAALGVNIVKGPFTWLNQACWAAYVGTVCLTVVLVVWEVVAWPVFQLRAIDKRLALWADATAATYAAAGADDLMSAQSSAGSSILIKAHNRSEAAEAYVQAAAAARTLSAMQQHQALPPLPPLPPLRQPSPQLSPQRTPTRQPSPLRQPLSHASQRQLLSPSRQYPSAPLASPWRSPPLPTAPPLLPEQPLRQQFPSAPPLSPQQLFP